MRGSAHEFQHLISFAQHGIIPDSNDDEDSYVNEGLSALAQDLAAAARCSRRWRTTSTTRSPRRRVPRAGELQPHRVQRHRRRRPDREPDHPGLQLLGLLRCLVRLPALPVRPLRRRCVPARGRERVRHGPRAHRGGHRPGRRRAADRLRHRAGGERPGQRRALRLELPVRPEPHVAVRHHRPPGLEHDPGQRHARRRNLRRAVRRRLRLRPGPGRRQDRHHHPDQRPAGLPGRNRPALDRSATRSPRPRAYAHRASGSGLFRAARLVSPSSSFQAGRLGFPWRLDFITIYRILSRHDETDDPARPLRPRPPPRPQPPPRRRPRRPARVHAPRPRPRLGRPHPARRHEVLGPGDAGRRPAPRLRADPRDRGAARLPAQPRLGLPDLADARGRRVRHLGRGRRQARLHDHRRRPRAARQPRRGHRRRRRRRPTRTTACGSRR